MGSGWRTILASDVTRDGVGLELVAPNDKVAAEVFRCDADRTLTFTTFRPAPLPELERLVADARRRLWRVDAKTLQIDFQGGYAELGGKVKSDAALRRCLHDMGANRLLLGDLKRELADFLGGERTTG